MIEAIYKAHEVNQTIIAFIDKIVAEVGKKKHEYTSCAVPAEMFEEMRRSYLPLRWKKLYSPMISRPVRRISV